MQFLLAGFFGGILRGGMGLFKYTVSYKNIEIRPYYFTVMVILTGIVGWISAWVVRDAIDIFLEVDDVPVSFALVAGYAGGDFIENLFKIAMREPHLFEIGAKIKKLGETIDISDEKKNK